MRVTIERRQRPLTINALRNSKQTWLITREIQDWRTWSENVCAGRDPIPWPVHVTVEHLRINHASAPDLGAPFFAYKALLDGIVNAGLLPGDGPGVVRRLTFEPYQVVGYDALRVVLEPVDGARVVPTLGE